MGYVGPRVIRQLRGSRPEATLVGPDAGCFAACLTSSPVLPECRVNQQRFADVRNFPDEALREMDAVVHLAAISNDPMGHACETATMDVNYRATVALPKKAQRGGVRSFVFALHFRWRDTRRCVQLPSVADSCTMVLSWPF